MNTTGNNLRATAVVVTHDRLQLLKRCVDCLRANAPARIVVVDNASTDGTAQWLDTQPDLCVIHQENCGGAGGFHTGIQKAYDMGAEWIWCMDDDVFPRPGCLHSLLRHADSEGTGILAPRRIMGDAVYSNDFLAFDLTHPLRSLHRGRHATRHVSQPTYIAGTAFEGLCVSRDVVSRVGLPNKELFIFCDDTDYCLRAQLAGFKILYVPTAEMDKHQFFCASNWTERQQQKKWKRYYMIRNSTYLNHHYGRNWAVRHLRGLLNLTGLVLTALLTAPFTQAYEMKDIPAFCRAWRAGIREQLGAITT